MSVRHQTVCPGFPGQPCGEIGDVYLTCWEVLDIPAEPPFYSSQNMGPQLAVVEHDDSLLFSYQGYLIRLCESCWKYLCSARVPVVAGRKGDQECDGLVLGSSGNRREWAGIGTNLNVGTR